MFVTARTFCVIYAHLRQSRHFTVIDCHCKWIVTVTSAEKLKGPVVIYIQFIPLHIGCSSQTHISCRVIEVLACKARCVAKTMKLQINLRKYEEVELFISTVAITEFNIYSRYVSTEGYYRSASSISANL